MTNERAWEHSDQADEYRTQGQFVDAGEYYTAAAYEYFGDGPPGFPAIHACHGEYMLLLASTCYRFGGRDERCVNRCRQGILVAEDMLERQLPPPAEENNYDTARRGSWYEYIGDFRTLANLDGAGDAYESAKAIYRMAENPPTAYSEQEHIWLMEFFETITQTTAKDDATWANIRSSFDTPLTDWVDYKAERLPGALDALLDRDQWLFPGER